MVTLRPFQLAERKHFDTPGRALLWTMRSGKTKTAIENALHLFDAGKIDGVIVLAPLGIHAQWLEQLEEWGRRGASIGMAWDAQRVKRCFAQAKEMRSVAEVLGSLAWLCFGKEQILNPVAWKAIVWFARKMRCLLIVDESHHWRTPGLKRVRRTLAIARRCPYARILTGTPDDNSPMNLFSQFEIIRKGALGFTTFENFRDHYAEVEMRRGAGGHEYPEIVGFKNRDELRARVRKLATIVTEEALDGLKLPESIRRPFELSEPERYAYDTLREELMLELDSGRLVTASAGGAALVRLQQVAAGYVVDECGEESALTPKPAKVEALLDFLDELGYPKKSIVVWIKSDYEAGMLMKRIPGAAIIKGKTKPEERKRLRLAFAARELKCLIAHPGCAGEGFDLSAADALVWFTHTWDAAQRRQAIARATKPGKPPPMSLDLAGRDTVDEAILRCLKDKRDTSRALHDVLSQALGRWRIPELD